MYTSAILVGQALVVPAMAYALSRFKFPLRDTIFFAVIMLMLLPFQVTMVPNVLTLRSLGLLNSAWAVILPICFAPFYIFLLRQFMVGLPREILEAAEIDGAGWWRRLYHVTLPCLSPVIYFTLIMGIIAVLQVFTPAYIMGGGPQGGTSGQPKQSTLFYALYMWAQAFEWLRMGYGCAMAWLLFIIILVLTLIAHRTAGKRVTYVG